MNDSHYHKQPDTDVYVEYPGTQFDCPVCHPVKAKQKATAVVKESLIAEPEGSLLKHASNPPTQRKYRP